MNELKGQSESHYLRTKMQQQSIIKKLKEKGLRLTKQRRLVIDLIVEEECFSCKEIYYKATKINNKIGIATIYRMISLLQDIGAISKRNSYCVVYSEESKEDEVCTIILEDDTMYALTIPKWHAIIQKGLCALGYEQEQKIKRILISER